MQHTIKYFNFSFYVRPQLTHAAAGVPLGSPKQMSLGFGSIAVSFAANALNNASQITSFSLMSNVKSENNSSVVADGQNLLLPFN